MREPSTVSHSVGCFIAPFGGKPRMPKYLSSDHDLLFRFVQWQANLRILEVTEIKTVPHVPLSHPFVERLIGTIRREYLDRTLFWTTADLENKLLDFQTYFNEASRACWARRANAGTRHAVTAASRRSSLLWLATPLPRPLSHANSCLTLQNSCPWRIAVSGHQKT